MSNSTNQSPINESAFLLMGGGEIGRFPYIQTNWREETLSWKESAYLGTALMNSPVTDIKGPDAAKFFEKICVNSFTNMAVGRIRHAILVNEKGQIMTDGVAMKIGDDHFRTYWLDPCLSFLALKYKNEFDIEVEMISGKEYFFQIAGPLSHEIMSAVSEDSLDDLKFAQHKMIKINGKDVRILRLGMTGNIAYEIHGPIEEADEIYRYIWSYGEPKGMKKLGQMAYTMNHTEGGFPNINMHYPLPWFESEELGYEGFSSFLESIPGAGFYNQYRNLVGSVGDDLQCRFVNPYEVGWGNLVKFTHDFIGRSYLEKLAETNQKTVVTLEWNADDIMEVYGSQFRGRNVEPFDYIEDRPNDIYFTVSYAFTYHADKILVNGEWVGNSVGRQVSEYYHRMISLAFIDKAYAEEGTELVVLWGSPGKPQKEIRAVVARYPYLDLEDNRTASV